MRLALNQPKSQQKKLAPFSNCNHHVIEFVGAVGEQRIRSKSDGSGPFRNV
jgi:hypothetical protein